MTLIGTCFSIRVTIACQAMRNPAVIARPRPSIVLRPSYKSSDSESSTSSFLLCIAITTTMPKQISIETISRGTIISLSIKCAIIEVQNGLVVTQTIMREIGANGDAIFMSRKQV